MHNTTEVELEHDLDTAARLLGVSVLTLRRLIHARAIGYRRIGTGRGRLRVTQAQINDYQARRTFAAAA